MTLQSFVAKLPHQVHLPDDTLTLALDGYAFIGNRCRELGSDVFETRVLLQRTICMLGAEAAQLFYSDKLQREGAAPNRVQATLFGRGGVQALDGSAHHARKQLLMSLLGPLEVARLVDKALAEWRAVEWHGRMALLDVAQDVLAKAVCAWAGITLDDDRRIRDIVAMIDGSGAAGPRHWRGRVGRARAEWWLMRQLQAVRAHKLEAHGALRTLADSDLDARTAAVELLNLLRPTVAVARYIAFAALALHEYPHSAELVGSDSLVEPFVHEVRRFYPFFPAVMARVRDAFEWHGVQFAEGERVMLDLYGTNHDARIWPDPEHFRPERFVGWRGDPYTLIPQGGGDTKTGHRCAGEALTIELVKSAVKFLTRELSYDVPAQDLGVSLARVPAQPADRFLVENVGKRAANAA